MVAPICIHGSVGVVDPAGAGHHMEDGPVGVRHGNRVLLFRCSPSCSRIGK